MLYVVAGLMIACVLIAFLILIFKKVGGGVIAILLALVMTVTYFTYPWNMLPEGSVKDVMSEAYDFADTNINETIAFVNRLLGKEKTIKQMTYQVDYSDDVTVIEDKTRDIVIELPEAISEEPIELSILAVDDDEAMAIGDMPEGVDHIEAYEVTLGDMHLLPGVASLSIPYKSKKST